tara:strand:+ start:1369 stop:1998 length:630 start_codon:yes stop_codon:yes gene_type:complete
MVNTQADFLELAIKVKALLFGNFTLKSGKESLYFFNISAFLESGYISNLADLFSQKIIQSEIEFEVIFGPAYKGIPLAAAVATKLSQQLSKPISVCFDRKEKKDHGEGGVLVGSVKDKKVLIIDDVLTAGTALKSSIDLIKEAEGVVSAAIVALDRQEIEDDQQVSISLEELLKIPIYSISNLENLISYLESSDKNRDIADQLKSSLKK